MGAGDVTSRDMRSFVDVVAAFADGVMERCRDRYGDEEGPLLADGIDLGTGEPIEWEGYVLSNLACQQNFLRTLEGLAVLAGETRYRARAEEWIGYALSELPDPASGMLYWGGHTNYDLLGDKPLFGNHELKCAYPYYEFLYGINPEVIRRFVEGFWNKHIQDWSTLLLNRHGEYTDWDRKEPWNHVYEGGPLPIVENTFLSFINTGSDLVCAGALLSSLTGAEEPLLWAKRLLGRYDQIRDESTGLGGYQFNHREPCRVRISFKEPWSEREEVNETTVLTNGVIQTRYGRAALTWMNLFEELGHDAGGEFLAMIRKDLTALGEYAYDVEDRSFSAVLVDGTKFSPDDCMEGVGYCSPQKLKKVPANGLMFLSYARAYRLTGDEFFWQMADSLAQGMGWSGLGSRDGREGIDLSKTDRISPPEDIRAEPNQNDICGLVGWLDLYRATGERAYLDAALHLGNRLVETYGLDGFLTTDGKAKVHVDNALPLALLHLQAALNGSDARLPTFYANLTGFHPKIIARRLAGG